MIDITTQIIKFRNFLVTSWPYLDLLMKNHNWDDDGRFIEDWIQINWEMLVERELLENTASLTALCGSYITYRVIPVKSNKIYSAITGGMQFYHFLKIWKMEF